MSSSLILWNSKESLNGIQWPSKNKPECQAQQGGIDKKLQRQKLDEEERKTAFIALVFIADIFIMSFSSIFNGMKF